MRSPRREAGFSFIEILVVMGIISVLVSMVVVLVPMIQENGRRTKSTDNVRTICQHLQNEAGIEVGKWPQLNGKNFVLSLVARNSLNKDNLDNLAILFSPGDGNYTLGAVSRKDYEPVTTSALKSDGHEEFLKLTSYAGRRNKEKCCKINAKDLETGSLIVCDDDDGDLHHAKGLVMGYTSGNAKFVKWEDLEVSPPENNNPFLGDQAPKTVNGDELMKMSSSN